MRTTALSWFVLSAVVSVLAIGMLAAEQTPLASIARIATSLSEGDSDGTLEFFDSHMKSYPEIEQKVVALTEQADISCAIDVVSDTETDGVHKLDLDWFMELKAQADNGQLERRRERVQVEMKLAKGGWKITSLTPISIFAPLFIR